MKIKKTYITIEPFVFKFQVAQIDQERLIIESKDKIILACEGKIQKIHEDQFLLQGHYNASFTTNCHCCLADFLFCSQQKFQLSLLSQYIFDRQSSQKFSDKLDVDYYETEEIDLADYFQNQFFLNIPFAVKCQNNCKGICSYCGVDLNKATCNCQKNTAYRPFAEYFKNR